VFLLHFFLYGHHFIYNQEPLTYIEGNIPLAGVLKSLYNYIFVTHCYKKTLIFAHIDLLNIYTKSVVFAGYY